MDSEDYERNSENDREGIILNTEENIMTNVNMIIEDIDKKEIDKSAEQVPSKEKREKHHSAHRR